MVSSSLKKTLKKNQILNIKINMLMKFQVLERLHISPEDFLKGAVCIAH